MTTYVNWISVNDKLPEKNGDYLVTYKSIVTKEMYVAVRSFAKNLYKIDDYDFASFRNQPGWYTYDGEYGFRRDTSVKAWAPLPEPYEESEDNK